MALALTGCAGDRDPYDPTGCDGKCDQGEDVEAPGLCLAIRGNGDRVFAHFGAVARIVEHYGTVDGVAGGSSGSITSFLIESVQLNPRVHQCGERACTGDERATRAALLFKSLQGYFDVLSSRSEEGIASQTVARLVAEVRARDLEGLLARDPEAGIEALRALLESPDLRDLINPEVLALIAESPDPVFHARDIVASLAAAASFSVTDETLFVRPGVITFEGVADKLGRVGSFYAGYGPADDDATEAFLAACAEPARGLDWADVAVLPAGDATCGALFDQLLIDYRGRLLAAEESHYSRIDDPVGGHLRALISTSVLEGEAVIGWQRARDDYRAARPVAWQPRFEDVRFGYWGRGADLARVAANPRGFDDLKTRKMTSLGEATWREVISYSPAEPGLSRALELPDGRVSAGGWSDLQPVLVLANLGCEEIVYVTRRGGASNFLDGITRLLGIGDGDRWALYDLANHDGSYQRSLAEADAVWCTDWDTPPTLDVPALIADGYHAPVESQSAFFAGDGAYDGVRDRLGIVGCSPGLTP